MRECSRVACFRWRLGLPAALSSGAVFVAMHLLICREREKEPAKSIAGSGLFVVHSSQLFALESVIARDASFE